MNKILLIFVLLILLLPVGDSEHALFQADMSSDSNSLDSSETTVGENRTSDFEPETFNYEGNATAFTSPDSSRESIDRFLDDVDSSLYVGVYQFTNLQIAEKLANLSKEGVSIRVLVEGQPVQGMPKREIASLNMISKEDCDVKLIGKDGNDPYEYYHPKYMIKDNRSVFITSENFVSSGFPSDNSNGNRGWGIILENKKAASYYGDVYQHDWEFGEDYEYQDIEYERYDITSSYYSPEFNRTEINGEFEITPVLSPDTAMDESTILEMIRGAEESIYVQQYYIRYNDTDENPYLEAVKEASKRGVEVKILLDSTWYNLEEDGNDKVVQELSSFSSDEGVDLEARLFSDYKGLLKSHNKGIIVDEENVLVSTINWNDNSIFQNRELGVIVKNSDVGKYYSQVFLDDWRDLVDPIADAGDEKTIAVGEEARLTGKNSWDDHEIIEYRWDVDGDGVAEKKGENITLEFDEEVECKITLTVEDVGGNTDKDSIELKVEKKDEKGLFSEVLRWFFLLSPAALITSFLVKELIFSRS
ncbi:MAG: phospholipase D-like domain-containing protein [Candidatus Natronoplasma sp.]